MRYTHDNPKKKTTTIIDKERIASLNALGFDWSVRLREQTAAQKSFEQRIADLKAYKEKHGHVNVKKSEDKSLNNFCNNTRRARNNPEKSTMTLTDERIASLNALGFEWNLNSDTKEKHMKQRKSFEQRIEDLKAYKEEHGHVNVKRSENKSLYGFCFSIRYARINPEKSTTLINEERIASLDALGFDWRTS